MNAIRHLTLGLKKWLPHVSIGIRLLTTPSFGLAQNTILSTNEAPVLTVNQTPVSAAEYVWFMQQERAAVFHIFETKSDTQDRTNFWDRQFSGTTARTLLRERTVKRSVESKVEQQLFSELGLAKEFRYETFLKNLDDYNRERESLAKQGGVVYGPVRYTQLQYYQHWMAELRMRATEQLAETRWDVNDEKLRDFFEHNQEQFRRAERAVPSQSSTPVFEDAKARVRTQYLDSLYKQLLSERIKSATVKLDSPKLDTLIE